MMDGADGMNVSHFVGNLGLSCLYVSVYIYK